MTFHPAPGETAWYIVTLAVVGDDESGYRTTYSGGPRYRTLQRAWDTGCAEFGHDDFQIAEVVDGVLLRLWWGARLIEETPGDLASVAEHLGLTTSPTRPAITLSCQNCGHTDVEHNGDLLDPDNLRGQRACGVPECQCGREPWRSLPPQFGDR